MPTWCIVGATRGIGFEFVRQLLARGDQVIAAFRTPSTANQLWQLSASQPVIGACELIQCDVTNEASIQVWPLKVHVFLDVILTIITT
jgi:NAD(P)-dependent dehydrogenase (short-subunit alcohol dehydrogenase family)